MLKQFLVLIMSIGLLAASVSSIAADGKKKQSYNEDQFISAFSGKSKKAVEETLGKPAKKEQSVKPQGANQMLARIRTDEKDSKENRVNVEMWYYDNIVNYDPKHTYKKTELTFVNDRCMNITFFNQ